jgi:hypothetical protein
VRCLDPRACAALLVLLAGCPGDDEPGEPVSLIEPGAWVRVVEPSPDAFAAMRPADAVCDDAGWFVNPFSGVLELDTALCDYVTFEQPTLVEIAAGDTITVRAYHDVLTSDAPATGYIGLALAGEIAWTYEVEIPSDWVEIEQTFAATRSLPAGSTLQVHVHNHGPNTWELIGVQVTPKG